MAARDSDHPCLRCPLPSSTRERTRWPLGYDYTVNAAHVDLSPRVTVWMGAAPDQPAFVRTLEHDVKSLFEMLAHAARLRVMFLAGAVSKREYMYEFLKRVAAGYTVEADGYATDDRRGRASRFFTLHRAGQRLPVFFVSNSPSSRHAGRVQEQFRASYAALRARGLGAAP